MEMKSGFDEAEMANPQVWQAKTLGDFISLQRGHDLTWRDRRIGEVPVMGSAGQNGTHNVALTKGPGVVLGRSGSSFGQAHYCEPDFWPHNTALYVTDFKENDPLFVFYFLSAIDFSRHNSGGAQQSLNRNFIAHISVRVPRPPEQRAIAAALGDVDALLGGLERLIAKKRDLKQAAMQQLLTGQVRLPGFNGKWRLKELKRIVQTPITDGPHLTPRFLESGIPFLSVNNLIDNKIDFRDLRFISLADHELFSRKCKPKKGDILLGKAASVGKVALVETDLDFNIWSPIAMIRVSDDYDPRFIYYQLQCTDVVRQINLLTNSSSQGNIGMGDIELLRLALPLLSEQSAIAMVLSDMDTELSALEARRDKTRGLKQALMQELLTGKTRLVPSGGTSCLDTPVPSHAPGTAVSSYLAAYAP